MEGLGGGAVPGQNNIFIMCHNALASWKNTLIAGLVKNKLVCQVCVLMPPQPVSPFVFCPRLHRMHVVHTTPVTVPGCILQQSFPPQRCEPASCHPHPVALARQHDDTMIASNEQCLEWSKAWGHWLARRQDAHLPNNYFFDCPWNQIVCPCRKHTTLC